MELRLRIVQPYRLIYIVIYKYIHPTHIDIHMHIHSVTFASASMLVPPLKRILIMIVNSLAMMSEREFKHHCYDSKDISIDIEKVDDRVNNWLTD